MEASDWRNSNSIYFTIKLRWERWRQHNTTTHYQQHNSSAPQLASLLQNIELLCRTGLFLCKLSPYSRVSIPRSPAGQQIVSQGVECFPILTDEESEAAGTGSVQSGRCGQHGACHYSRHHHVIRDAGNVRDCGIISAALYLVTSNYYDVPPTCGAATHQAAALTCY